MEGKVLRYIYADDLIQFPKLARSMFKDRARQFADRLGWEVEVHADGSERDEYNDMNPLYVIWERSDGSHGGSMRFLARSSVRQPVLSHDQRTEHPIPKSLHLEGSC